MLDQCLSTKVLPGEILSPSHLLPVRTSTLPHCQNQSNISSFFLSFLFYFPSVSQQPNSESCRKNFTLKASAGSATKSEAESSASKLAFDADSRRDESRLLWEASKRFFVDKDGRKMGEERRGFVVRLEENKETLWRAICQIASFFSVLVFAVGVFVLALWRPG